MKNVYSVYQINHYIRNILEDDAVLDSVFIEGEVSNFKAHSSGHWYFTLKDDKSALSCVMFKNYAESAFFPYNGARLVVFGKVGVYEKTGQYQLYAEALEPWGKGALAAEFERLKEKLLKEGLFDAKYKKPVPQFVRRVAIITSPTGAAVRDIIQIAKRRNPGVELVVSPTLVQGEAAAKDIARALAEVNEWSETTAVDVIILARGGGSIEDLWPFNEEIVARAIFASKIPVISAVGHETDFTIADFTADMRAPTPSAAAELAVFRLADLRYTFETHLENMARNINIRIERQRERLGFLAKRCSLKSYLEEVYNYQILLEKLMKNISREMNHKLQVSRERLRSQAVLIESFSPMKVLERGYALVYQDGIVRKTAAGLKAGDELTVKFRDGDVAARVD